MIDPVMVAESGAVLLDDEARAAIVTELLPLATVITPNLPEARVLASGAGAGGRDARGAASRATTSRTWRARCTRSGPQNVVVTGGHRDEVTDVFFDGTTIQLLAGERHPDGAAHGSGCTHSSALAAHLALGFTPLEAARAARAIASEAVRDGTARDRRGRGPVNALGAASGADGASAGATERGASRA